MKKKREAPKSTAIWLAIVKDYLSSGLSKEIFCKNRQLNFPTFNKWCSRITPKKQPLAIEAQKSNFIPVTIAVPKMNYSKLGVELPNGIKLSIFDIDFGSQELQKILRICCNVVNG